MKHVNEASCPWLGHSNKLPPNFTEVSSDEFWRWFSQHYHLCSWALHWIVKEDKGHPFYGAQLTLFVNEHERNGFGFVKRVSEALYVTPKTYFRFFDCEHDMQHVANLGRCLNSYKCSKCDFRETIDSSD